MRWHDDAYKCSAPRRRRTRQGAIDCGAFKITKRIGSPPKLDDLQQFRIVEQLEFDDGGD